jgi:hypothetical protein
MEVEVIEEPLYMDEKGSWETMGELAGEKEKFCWKGPAEVRMGSLSTRKVSRGKGTAPLLGGWARAWPWCKWSREYS